MVLVWQVLTSGTCDYKTTGRLEIYQFANQDSRIRSISALLFTQDVCSSGSRAGCVADLWWSLPAAENFSSPSGRSWSSAISNDELHRETPDHSSCIHNMHHKRFARLSRKLSTRLCVSVLCSIRLDQRWLIKPRCTHRGLQVDLPAEMWWPIYCILQSLQRSAGFNRFRERRMYEEQCRQAVLRTIQQFNNQPGLSVSKLQLAIYYSLLIQLSECPEYLWEQQWMLYQHCKHHGSEQYFFILCLPIQLVVQLWC